MEDSVIRRKNHLNTIFTKLFDKQLNVKDEYQMNMLNSAVFLAIQKGLAIHNYIFRLNVNGVQSETLADDAAYDSEVRILDTFTESAENVLDEIKNIVTMPHNSTYNTAEWLRAIAVIAYLKELVVPTNSSIDKLMNIMLEHCPHLYSDDCNRQAYYAYEKLMNLTTYHTLVQTNYIKLKNSDFDALNEILERCTETEHALKSRSLNGADNINRYGFYGSERPLGIRMENVGDPCKNVYSFEKFVKALQEIIEDGETLIITIFSWDEKQLHMPENEIFRITSNDCKHLVDPANPIYQWD